MRKETVIACLINILGGAIIGYNTGIVSGMSLPLISCTLFSPEDNINVSLYQGLFTASILVLAAVGSPLGVYIQKIWSMKNTMFLLAAMSTVFPLLMIIMKNFWYITVMRMFLGLSVGFSSALCSHYANSLVDERIKGRVGSLFQLSVTLFIFLAQVMNFFFVEEFDVNACVPLTDLSWRMQLGISSILGVLLFILLFFAPEMKEDKQFTKEVKSKESLYSSKNIKWIIFGIMLALMNQFTGINGVMYYSAQILADAGVENVLLTQLLVVGLWNMLTVFIFMAVVDRLSRRYIMLIALSIMIIGTVALITSFMVSGIAMVALGGMIFYILGFEVGPGPLFYVMATQDFPKNLVNQGLSLSNTTLYILNITISFVFPVMNSSLGAGVTFSILCGFQVLSLVYFGFTMTDEKKSKVENGKPSVTHTAASKSVEI